MRLSRSIYNNTRGITLMRSQVRAFGNYPSPSLLANKLKPEDLIIQQIKENQQETDEPKQMNPHSIFYRQFSRSFTKICLLSIGTFYSLSFLHDALEEYEKDE